MEVLRVGAHASRLIALGLPVVGFQVMASGMYQAIGKALPALLLSMARQLFFLIPLVLILPLIWSLEGIWLAFPVADAGAFVVAAFLFRGEMEYMRKQCS
jgi:Na+-driven multidrug efflux pump